MKSTLLLSNKGNHQKITKILVEKKDRSMGEFFHALGHSLLEKIQIGHRDIGSEIRKAIDLKPMFHIHIGSFDLAITDSVVSIFLTVIILILLAIIFVGKPKWIPNKRQAFIEKIMDSVLGMAKGFGLNQKQAEIILPWTLTIGLYIMVSNLVSIFHLHPASKNPIFPISLAIFTIFYVIIMGIRFVGLKGFFGSLINPMPAMLPFNLLDYIIKPLSLSFRLFGNIFGAFILIEFLTLVVPLILPNIFGLWFDIGDGIIQGVIFMFLSISYIGEIIEKAEASETLAEEKKEKRLRKKQEKRQKVA